MRIGELSSRQVSEPSSLPPGKSDLHNSWCQVGLGSTLDGVSELDHLPADKDLSLVAGTIWIILAHCRSLSAKTVTSREWGQVEGKTMEGAESRGWEAQGDMVIGGTIEPMAVVGHQSDSDGL